MLAFQVVEEVRKKSVQVKQNQECQYLYKFAEEIQRKNNTN